ncbi:MAG: RsiV family protein [Rhodomicrobium sp.]
MKVLKLLVSPAALCIWAICVCVGFSIAGSNASRTVTLSQETKFGYAKTSFPIQMKRWDEALFNLLTTRAKGDMAEFLKGAEQDAAAKPQETEADAPAWTPYVQSSGYIEQFRTLRFVSYLEAASMVQGDAQPSIDFKTVNFDKEGHRELSLGDILEGAADKSKALEALAAYARADLKDKTGEEGEEESDALLELTRPDLSVYERFTLCPSTKLGNAAGLTIHFPPSASGPYAGSDFHVTVPYTVFAKFLKPGMKALFAGEPRQAPVPLEEAGI